MRLIDADALLKNYQDKVCCGISCVGCPFIIDIVYGGCKFENYMKKAPTVVEFEEPITKVYVRGEKYEKVVRCKDCKHHQYCCRGSIPVDDNGFCSNGERRDDETDRR